MSNWDFKIRIVAAAETFLKSLNGKPASAEEICAYIRDNNITQKRYMISTADIGRFIYMVDNPNIQRIEHARACKGAQLYKWIGETA